jgi:hypothetical protein
MTVAGSSDIRKYLLQIFIWYPHFLVPQNGLYLTDIGDFNNFHTGFSEHGVAYVSGHLPRLDWGHLEANKGGDTALDNRTGAVGTTSPQADHG